jgi:hypothetical protein
MFVGHFPTDVLLAIPNVRSFGSLRSPWNMATVNTGYGERVPATAHAPLTSPGLQRRTAFPRS